MGSLDDPLEFARQLATSHPKTVDKAVALVWWHGREPSPTPVAASRIARQLHEAGYAQQNASRIAGIMDRDSRVRKARAGGYRIDPASQQQLDELFQPLLGPKPPQASDSVIPQDLVQGTRAYLVRVVYQVNASYDLTLYDCCAVMCRRLLETLIIELYEHLQREAEIRSADGNYRMFSGLLSHLENDKALHLGRQTLRGLKAFKSLGDQAAHNRRFNAKKADIDGVRDDVRLATEELLHLSGLLKP